MSANGNIRVFSVSASRLLVEGICKEMGITHGANHITEFADGESAFGLKKRYAGRTALLFSPPASRSTIT